MNDSSSPGGSPSQERAPQRCLSVHLTTSIDAINLDTRAKQLRSTRSGDIIHEADGVRHAHPSSLNPCVSTALQRFGASQRHCRFVLQFLSLSASAIGRANVPHSGE